MSHLCRVLDDSGVSQHRFRAKRHQAAAKRNAAQIFQLQLDKLEMSSHILTLQGKLAEWEEWWWSDCKSTLVLNEHSLEYSAALEAAGNHSSLPGLEAAVPSTPPGLETVSAHNAQLDCGRLQVANEDSTTDCADETHVSSTDDVGVFSAWRQCRQPASERDVDHHADDSQADHNNSAPTACKKASANYEQDHDELDVPEFCFVQLKYIISYTAAEFAKKRNMEADIFTNIVNEHEEKFHKDDEHALAFSKSDVQAIIELVTTRCAIALSLHEQPGEDDGDAQTLHTRGYRLGEVTGTSGALCFTCKRRFLDIHTRMLHEVYDHGAMYCQPEQGEKPPSRKEVKDMLEAMEEKAKFKRT